MLSSFFAFAALLPLLLYAQVDFDESPTCVDGIQIITIAGTGQKGYGTIEGLTDEVKDSIPDSASVALEYPANSRPYFASVNSGITNLTNYIKHFVDGCPDVRLVLLGYSQGAHVSLSTLCGWTTVAFQFGIFSPIATAYSDRIVAVAAYGDPTHIYPTDYDRGTSTNNGIFPRQVGLCNFESEKIASWCDRGDQFCDACPPPVSTLVPNPRGCNKSTHGSYWRKYNPDVVSFIRSRYQEVASTILPPLATSTSTSTTTSSSSTSSSSTSRSFSSSVRSTSSRRSSTRSSTRSSRSTTRTSTSRAVSTTSTTVRLSTNTVTADSTTTPEPTDSAGTRLRPFFAAPLDALRRRR